MVIQITVENATLIGCCKAEDKKVTIYEGRGLTKVVLVDMG